MGNGCRHGGMSPKSFLDKNSPYDNLLKYKEVNIMKHTVTKKTAEILHKIEDIEKEVMNLKLSVLKGLAPSQKKIISLKGILKGIEITEQDIVDTEKSLYNKIEL